MKVAAVLDKDICVYFGDKCEIYTSKPISFHVPGTFWGLHLKENKTFVLNSKPSPLFPCNFKPPKHLSLREGNNPPANWNRFRDASTFLFNTTFFLIFTFPFLAWVHMAHSLSILITGWIMTISNLGRGGEASIREMSFHGNLCQVRWFWASFLWLFFSTLLRTWIPISLFVS